jgi:hypothetical protein
MLECGEGVALSENVGSKPYHIPLSWPASPIPSARARRRSRLAPPPPAKPPPTSAEDLNSYPNQILRYYLSHGAVVGRREDFSLDDL